MKKLLALVLALVMVLALTACGGSGSSGSDGASVSANLSMGTGGESGTYYAYGGVLATYLGQETDIAVTVNSTGGSKANITGIDQGDYDLATVQSDVLGYAYNGTNTYADSGAVTSFVALGALYAETVQIVTCNPDIKSPADLAGKSVSVGDVGSGSYYNTVDILAAYGMTIEDDINPVYQSFADSAESLKDGKIDAAVITAGPPTAAITELATNNDVYLVSIDDEHMDILLESNPWYASYTVPAGTYNGFDEDAATICMKATLIARADIDDDVAYAIVSTIFEGKDAITELHGMGAQLDLTFATEGIAAPFSPGAARYYAENGIDVG